MDASESGESGAAKDVGEDGFGLVVSGVSDGNSGAMAGINQRLEEIIASTTASVFEVGAFHFGFTSYMSGSRVKFQSMFGGEIGDEFFVGVRGAAAEFVIEVNDA